MTERGILLLSGGIDSPVAGLLAKRSGIELIGLHLSNEKYTDATPREKCIQLAPKIGLRRLHIIEISPILEQYAKAPAHHYYFILMKRLFLKLAEKVARMENATLIVTGESLGQVSSQTLSCLSVIDKATSLPVIRPLLSLSKDQIVALARDFDTFDISTGPEFCDILGPKHPKTKVTLDEILWIERLLEEKLRMFFEIVFARRKRRIMNVNDHQLTLFEYGDGNGEEIEEQRPITVSS